MCLIIYILSTDGWDCWINHCATYPKQETVCLWLNGITLSTASSERKFSGDRCSTNCLLTFNYRPYTHESWMWVTSWSIPLEPTKYIQNTLNELSLLFLWYSMFLAHFEGSIHHGEWSIESWKRFMVIAWNTQEQYSLAIAQELLFGIFAYPQDFLARVAVCSTPQIQLWNYGLLFLPCPLTE